MSYKIKTPLLFQFLSELAWADLDQSRSKLIDSLVVLRVSDNTEFGLLPSATVLYGAHLVNVAYSSINNVVVEISTPRGDESIVYSDLFASESEEMLSLMKAIVQDLRSTARAILTDRQLWRKCKTDFSDGCEVILHFTDLTERAVISCGYHDSDTRPYLRKETI